MQYFDNLTILTHMFLLTNQGKLLKMQRNAENTCIDVKLFVVCDVSMNR